MQLLNNVIKNPSGFDSLSNYIGESEFPGFYVILTQNRDSDRLTRSNFTCALDQLGGESENIQIFRFGHWFCGWWECLTVKEKSKEYDIALQIEKSLSDYLVLDESHYWELQYNEATDFWNSLLLREKIELCKEYCISIFSARYDYIPENNGSLDTYLMTE